MHSSILKGCLGVAAAVALAVTMTPNAAMAASHNDDSRQPNRAAGPPPGAACSTDGWVQACYEAYGDVIWVKDTKADGYHADVHFWGWNGNGWDPSQTCHDRLGADAGWTYCDGFADMIPEHSSITLWPMESDGDEDVVPSSGGTQIHSSTT